MAWRGVSSSSTYRPRAPLLGQPPFGPPPPPLHPPPFGIAGPCSVPPPGHPAAAAAAASCGAFAAPAPGSHYLTAEARGRFTRPQCSNFSIDPSTMIALGSSRQIAPPPHLQVSQWNPTPVKQPLPDNSEKASEEFLRCIAANKPLPEYLKGNMAHNLADAIKSAGVLKDAVKADPEFKKHASKSKSCPRSRSRSRGKSCNRIRGKSRSRSRGRSRGRSRAKSRAKSCARSRSRGRSKSRVRGKSRARSKSRKRSKSRARSGSSLSPVSKKAKKRSHALSKSRSKRSRSRSSSSDKRLTKEKRSKSYHSPSPSSIPSSAPSLTPRPSPVPSPIPSNKVMGGGLLEGLKMVMNSQELEDKIPTLKDAILTIKASDESQRRGHRTVDQQQEIAENCPVENDSMLLPHDRVGRDFFWLQGRIDEEPTARKTDDFDDEESFLYGNQDTEGKHSSAALFPAFTEPRKDVRAQQDKVESCARYSEKRSQSMSMLSSFEDQLVLRQASRQASANLDNSEYEKIKNILKGLGTSGGSDITVKPLKDGKHELPGQQLSSISALTELNNPNVRQALESLQSLIKATKEKRENSDSSSVSQTSSDKHKANGDEERRKDRQARISQVEILTKQLEGLLDKHGFPFLTPVIGFYCQKCEEFIGDLNLAESHAGTHQHSTSSKAGQMDKDPAESKGHPGFCSSSGSSSRDHWDQYHHKGSGEHRNQQHQSQGDRNHRSRSEQENISLKEEMMKERMLITVSRDLTAPKVKVKEEAKPARVRDRNGRGRSKESPDRQASSDSSDSDKPHKDKAKKKKKKNKKEKKKRKEKG